MDSKTQTDKLAMDTNYFVSDDKVEKLSENCQFCVGNIVAPEAFPPDESQMEGTISLYEISSDIFGLVTNNRVMARTDPKVVCDSKFYFKGFGWLVLTPGDIACVTTNEELDATVIELKRHCVTVLKERGASFLKITNAQLNNQIAIVQLQNGEFSFARGVIRAIQGKFLNYYIVGCSNRPQILLWDQHAIGLHCSQAKETDCLLGSMAVATHLPDIVEFHLASRNSVITSPTFPEVSARLQLKLQRHIPKWAFIAHDESDPAIWGMCYNSARDELFLADMENDVVRSMRLRENSNDLRDVFSVGFGSLSSVCHMSETDTLLVCCDEWLVALSRNGNEWREAHRMQTESTEKYAEISCALSDSRVLIGEYESKYMELFKVETGPRIARVKRIQIAEQYSCFSATCGSETLVAMSYYNNDLRVHRLRGNRLEELARTKLQDPICLMWLADRLLVEEFNTDTQISSVIELKMSGRTIERLRTLIAPEANIKVFRWCEVYDGLAFFEYNSKGILHFKFASYI